MEKSESDFWWGIKGICILAVIGIHSFVGREITAEVVWIKQFINFPVILFIFLSGYFVKTDQVSADWKVWIRKRFIRILGPYLLCSMFYLIYAHLVKEIHMNYKGVIASLILGTSNIQMYYCVVMFQLILLTPILVKRKDSIWFRIAVFIVTLFSVMIKYIDEWWHCIPSIYGSFCGAWLLFYVYGMYCAEKEQGENVGVYRKVFALILSGVLLLVETRIMWQTEVYRGFSTSQVRISNFLFGFCLINLLLPLSKKQIKCYQGLIWLGKKSFFIYLIHMFVVDTLLYFMPNIHYMAVWIITVAASCAFCLVAVPIFERMRRLVKNAGTKFDNQ